MKMGLPDWMASESASARQEGNKRQVRLAG